MLRCVCLVKCLVIGRDRELKAKTKTTTTSTAKNMIRISKTTTLHECITLHCSSLCRRSQLHNNSFRFLLFSLITFLCLGRFLISSLSNIEHWQRRQKVVRTYVTLIVHFDVVCVLRRATWCEELWISPPVWREWTTLRRGSSVRTRERRRSKTRKNPTVNY